MTRFVVDASVAVKWFIDEDQDEHDADMALGLLERAATGHCRFVQPPHWVSEIAAVLARRQPESAANSIADLLSLHFYSVTTSPKVYRRAIAISQQLNHHLFDTFYHAAALEEAIPFVTADRQYFNKAKKLGNIVMLNSLTSA